MNIPYYPKSFHEDIPQYSSWEVEIFGPPHLYGIDKYEVLESVVYDYSRVLEQNDHERPNFLSRPKHEYDREQRFKSTLRQLLGGCRDQIPAEILDCFFNCEVNWDPHQVWNSIRNILKKRKLVLCEMTSKDKETYYKTIATKKFYNRIPEILIHHYYKHKIVLPVIDYEELYREFKAIHHRFNNSSEIIERLAHKKIHKRAIAGCGDCLKRVYFPNIRYCILRMLQDKGVVFQYDIPLLRTKRKLPVLAKVWADLTPEDKASNFCNQDDNPLL